MKHFPFSVRPRETLPVWVHRTVTGLVDAVLNRTVRTAPTPGDLAETVHLIRTTVKRLRSLLRLLRPVIPPPFFERENVRLRTAARRLAAGRDQTVILQTLDTLAAAGDDKDRTALGHLKEIASKKFRPASHPATLRAVQTSSRALTAFQRSLLRLDLTNTAWPALAITKSFHRARKRMKDAVQSPGPASFHSWRIAVKALYYQLQWLSPLWPIKLSSMVSLLHHLEDALGAEHDVWILHDKMTAASKSSPDPSAAKVFQSLVKHRSRHLRHTAKSLGKRLFHQHPRRFEGNLLRHATAWQENSHSS